MYFNKGNVLDFLVKNVYKDVRDIEIKDVHFSQDSSLDDLYRDTGYCVTIRRGNTRDRYYVSDTLFMKISISNSYVNYHYDVDYSCEWMKVMLDNVIRIGEYTEVVRYKCTSQITEYESMINNLETKIENNNQILDRICNENVINS